MAELADAGVKRISLATSLFRAAMTGLLAAATEVRDWWHASITSTARCRRRTWNKFSVGVTLA